MLTLVLLASLGQIYEQDFYFVQAQENFVLDQLPSPVRYSRYLPPAVVKQVDLWHDPCWRCRARASDELQAMPGVARWMFWVHRSTSLQLRLYSEAMLKKLITCGNCHGSGICPKYVGEPLDSGSCIHCWTLRLHHDADHISQVCRRCDGRGYFEQMPDCPFGLRHIYQAGE